MLADRRKREDRAEAIADFQRQGLVVPASQIAPADEAGLYRDTETGNLLQVTTGRDDHPISHVILTEGWRAGRSPAAHSRPERARQAQTSPGGHRSRPGDVQDARRRLADVTSGAKLVPFLVASGPQARTSLTQPSLDLVEQLVSETGADLRLVRDSAVVVYGTDPEATQRAIDKLGHPKAVTANLEGDLTRYRNRVAFLVPAIPLRTSCHRTPNRRVNSLLSTASWR